MNLSYTEYGTIYCQIQGYMDTNGRVYNSIQQGQTARTGPNDDSQGYKTYISVFSDLTCFVVFSFPYGIWS